MISLDVIVGFYMPQAAGWLFLVFVLLVESLCLSRWLSKSWFNTRIWLAVLAANAVTTLLGFVALDEQHHGGHLLNWVPIDEHYSRVIIGRTILIFTTSFLCSVLIETILLYLLLKNHFIRLRIISGAILINVITYLIAGIILAWYIRDYEKTHVSPFDYWTPERIKKFKCDCPKTDTLPYVNFCITGYTSYELKQLKVREWKNGLVVDSFQPERHFPNSGIDKQMKRTDLIINRTLHTKSNYEFIVPGYKPYMLSDLKMGVHFYFPGYACCLDSFSIDGVFQAYNNKIEFEKK
ncbi:MAG: hypothetical protein JST26_19780 [Bacteroidetes bacterium]|nr:hypothetical protein [Bacteroidota bacterium]